MARNGGGPGEGEQETLFGSLDQFTRSGQEWEGMPEFTQRDLAPWNSVLVHFESRADMDAFAELIEQPLTEKTQSVWYPKAEILRMVDKRYADEEPPR